MRNFSGSLIAAGLLLVSATALAAPGDMTVADFISRVERLEARGALALLSSDVGTLRSEVEASSTLYRARLAADREAGRQPHSCPPPAGRARMSSDDLVAHMRSYPEARRAQLTVREAVSDLMRRRYPCRG